MKNKFHRWSYGLFIFAAIVVLTDAILAGKAVIDKVTKINVERQQYYNAGRNHHYSYRLFTSEHSFPVTEEFSKAIKVDQKIEYTISPIFNEVKSYGLLTSANREVYSLRIFTDFIIPLLVIITMGIVLLSQKKLSTLVFIVQMLLIADLIFLII